LRQRLSERFQNDREKTLKKYPVSHDDKPGIFAEQCCYAK